MCKVSFFSTPHFSPILVKFVLLDVCVSSQYLKCTHKLFHHNRVCTIVVWIGCSDQRFERSCVKICLQASNPPPLTMHLVLHNSQVFIESKWSGKSEQNKQLLDTSCICYKKKSFVFSLLPQNEHVSPDSHWVRPPPPLPKCTPTTKWTAN